MITFNHWVRGNTTTPPMTLLDTTDRAPDQTADKVAAWVRSHCASGQR
jgi:hypothetical protein